MISRQRKMIYGILCMVCFAVGTFAARVLNSGRTHADATRATERREKAADLTTTPVIAEVGGETITQDDIDWEYSLATQEVDDKDSLTPIPDLGGRMHEELGNLRRSILAALIERKVLFSYVRKDTAFGLENPARYTACLSEWQRLEQEANAQGNAGGAAALLRRGGGRERFKARLCERSILDQYIRERLYASVKIEDAEVVEYYKNHVAEFKRPEMAVIRQVLLGDEAEAKKWRARINPGNFAEIARSHSLAPEASKDGRLGPFAHGTMPAVFDVAFRLKKGEITEVLKSNYGYHIIMGVEVLPRVDLSLDAARPRIEASLKQKKREQAYSNWVEQALAAINVAAPKAMW